MNQHGFPGFPPATLRYLRRLARNNNRDWFQANKQRYEDDVLEHALAFIEAMTQPLERIAPRFTAVAKRTGGSLMRVYRDVRFSKDKHPYKTNIGIQFRHEAARDVHAPGYYLHIDPDSVFLGVGMWHPDSSALGAIRDTIVEHPAQWKKARDNRRFRRQFELAGASLTRPPRGFDKDHSYIEDLKRKDFIAVRNFVHSDIEGAGFIGEVVDAFGAATPFQRFLCTATGVPF